MKQPPADLDEVLGALAEPTRRRLLHAVAERGAATATRLSADLPITRQAVVKHLAVLDRAGLVDGYKEGREVYYQVRPDLMAEAATWMAELAAEWDRRLSAIKRLAEGEGGTEG